MTKLPHESWRVQGLGYDERFPRYKVGPLCFVPSCSRLADHAHHIWRRSFLAGDYGWVALEDGTILQNLCGLCYMHHNLVTENEAEIRYTEAGNFVWMEQKDSNQMLLFPQPKKWGAPEEEPRNDLRGEHDMQAPGHVEKCPTCSRALPREKSAKREGTKNRERWTITVPKDERENGADVLDTLLEEAANMIGHDADNTKTKYHTLAFALGMFVMYAEELMSDS